MLHKKMYNKNIFLDGKTPYYHDFTWNNEECKFEINKPIKIPKIDLPVISFSSYRDEHVFLCETQEILYFYEHSSKQNGEFMLDGPYFIDVHKHIDIEKFPMKEIYCLRNSFYIIDIYGNLWVLSIKDDGNESYFNHYIKKGKIPPRTENVKLIKNAPYIQKSFKFNTLSKCQKVYTNYPFGVTVLANNILYWVTSDGETGVIIENINDCLLESVNLEIFLYTLTEDWDEFGNNNTLYKKYRILNNRKLEQPSINGVKIAHATQNVKFVRKDAANGAILIIIDGKMYYGRDVSTQMNTSMLEVDEKIIDSFMESSDFIFFNTDKNNLYWFNSPTQNLTQIKHESDEPVIISYPIQRRMKSASSSEL